MDSFSEATSGGGRVEFRGKERFCIKKVGKARIGPCWVSSGSKLEASTTMGRQGGPVIFIPHKWSCLQRSDDFAHYRD